VETENASKSTKGRTGLTRVLPVLVASGVIATFVSLLAAHWWVADILANLRVQQVIGLVTLLAICLVIRRPRCVLVTLVLIAIHGSFFVSRYQASSAIDPSSVVRVMTANVLTSNPNANEIVTQIRDQTPDVVAILELDSSLAEHLNRALSDGYPHRCVRPDDHGNFGIGLYSRHSMVDIDVIQFDRSIESIAATVQCNSFPFRLIATHPLPPIGTIGFDRRNHHLTSLADHIDTLRDDPDQMPVIVMGDLNLTPWSPIFGTLEERTGLSRAVIGFGLMPTWYAKESFAFGLVLDHVLISDGLKCVSHHVGDSFGSDHRAVTADVAREQ
tara:strand:+ start:193757 stop:194743 length:987 start_codon:yes stop_codon:yes gene_type:complete